MNCRLCGNVLSHKFIDLGDCPPANSFLTSEQLRQPEPSYPLDIYVCEKCFLVQVDAYKRPEEIFARDYVYFSSCSRTWLEHARAYAGMITTRFPLGGDDLVVEVASNDGYLLQYFQEKKIPVLGIEPSESVATAARGKGIDTIIDFFGKRLARELADSGKKADLLIGNNVLAHVPDINDFVAGMKILLKKEGVITMEFPHLLPLVENNQFDTIYHEHYSYFSFDAVCRLFLKHGLKIFDVEQLSTHGGSLRVYGKQEDDAGKTASARVESLSRLEEDKGMRELSFYQGFAKKADRVRADFLDFLTTQKRQGKNVVAYGAAAKGNTLLNFCGVHEDLIAFVVDISKSKQGKFLPGNHIPVVAEQKIREARPHFIVILPWNIKEEIMTQLHYVREWGARFVIPLPRLEVL